MSTKRKKHYHLRVGGRLHRIKSRMWHLYKDAGWIVKATNRQGELRPGIVIGFVDDEETLIDTVRRRYVWLNLNCFIIERAAKFYMYGPNLTPIEREFEIRDAYVR